VDAWLAPTEFDGYRLVRLLGRGGMGEVFLAEDTVLDRPVAIKFITGVWTPDARERFLREGRAIARLQHPNVVAVYRLGETRGRPYLVSEFVRGQPLDALPLPLPWRHALPLALALGRGLAAAHRRGVVHRDIKPANAMLSDDGEIKLLDFGLAKLVEQADLAMVGTTPLPAPEVAAAARAIASADETIVQPALGRRADADRRGLTEAGVLIGTPLYLAPELWRAEPATLRSDVYALGAMLYELCAGKPPHWAKRRDPASLALSVQSSDAPPLARVVPDIHPELAAIIDRCLRRDRADRFSSAEQVLAALERIGADARTPHVPEGNPYRGLYAFEEQHHDLFFGRDAEVRALTERLRSDTFVLLVGDSGVGKSSLARAGVAPLVREGALGERASWKVCTLVPGRHPVASLVVALAATLGLDEAVLDGLLAREPGGLGREVRRAIGADGGLLLIVDQLEELVTLADEPSAAAVGEALASLAVRSPGVRLVATLRSDFLARLAVVPGLGEVVTGSLVIVQPLGREAVREAIEGPVQVKGAHFGSTAMVDALVDAAAGADASLPLLQFALAELWEQRDPATGVIPESALQAIGGVAGALGRHADQVLQTLRPAERAAAERILTSMVGVSGTRVRRSHAELAERDKLAGPTLDALVRGRLLVVGEMDGGSAYELAHEALVSGWGTLRQWLQRDGERRSVRERLERAVGDWEHHGRAAELLWSERELAELAVLDRRELRAGEAEFARASRRVLRRRRWVAWGSIAGLTAAFLLVAGLVRARVTRQMTEQVEEHRTRASALARDARAKMEAAAATARQAYGLFDAGQSAEAEPLWAQVLSARTSARAALEEASRRLEAAFVLDSSRRDVQDAMAAVLYDRALLAEEMGAPTDEVLARLALYDRTGAWRRRWFQPATLSLETRPAGAEVTIARYEKQSDGRRVLQAAYKLGRTPLHAISLVPGSYLLELALAGHAPIKYPVLLARGESLPASFEIPRAEEVPEGYVYVPPGRFLFGTADEESRSFFQTAPLHPVWTGGYLIGRYEVTWGEWIAYLQAIPPQQWDARTLQSHGAFALRPLAGTWELFMQPTTVPYRARAGELVHYRDRKQRAAQDWLRMPVSGVAVYDSRGYATWLAQSGRLPGARLCSDREWERAARGADERMYPHGDRLQPDDANIDQTYGRQSPAFGPDEVGSHPLSASPFGLADMAGNVWEWTAGSLGQWVVRGGSFYFGARTASSMNREATEATVRDLNVGLRVCGGLPSRFGTNAPAPH
jgi:serine/threonine protein kinase/formylglycine-generating enzyme required for sulfatase activity